MSALPNSEILNGLSPEHEQFSSLVASGVSYSSAAKLTGFHVQHGWRLMQMPAIRARIAELVATPQDRAKAGIEAELMMLRARAADADLDSEGRANIELRLKLLMAHAKLLGMIVDQKKVARVSLDLGKLGRQQLGDHVASILDTLEPGARQRISAMIEAPADEVLEPDAEEPVRKRKPSTSDAR